jgi:hypothetical protein
MSASHLASCLDRGRDERRRYDSQRWCDGPIQCLARPTTEWTSPRTLATIPSTGRYRHKAPMARDPFDTRPQSFSPHLMPDDGALSFGHSALNGTQLIQYEFRAYAARKACARQDHEDRPDIVYPRCLRAYPGGLHRKYLRQQGQPHARHLHERATQQRNRSSSRWRKLRPRH